MERVSDRQEKMERHCRTGQSPQWAVEPMEEEEEEEDYYYYLERKRITCVQNTQ